MRKIDIPGYSSWVAMRYRCRNNKCNGYENYGGRGIGVCERWDSSFDNFIENAKEAFRAAD